MARYELTMFGGEKLLIDGAIEEMEHMRVHLVGTGFVLFKEIKAGSTVPPREVVISTSQIALLRPLPEGSTTGSNFKPKR